MFELIARVVLASGAMATAGILGQPSFEVTWKASLFFAAYSYLLYMMGQRGLRNPGIAGLAAVVDGGVLAVFLADLGQLQYFGSLCAIPMVLAYFRDRANAAMMSPLVASWLLTGANLFGGGNAFTPMLLVQALGVLVLGVALSQVRTIRENRREKAKEADVPLPVVEQDPVHPPTTETVEIAPGEYNDFRESFRALTESARELEKRGRRDRACVQLFESVARQSNAPFAAIASSVQDLTGAEAVLLHVLSSPSESAVVRGVAGNADSLNETTITISKGLTETEVLDRANSVIEGAKGSDSVFASLALKLRGRLVGILTLFHSNSIELEASTRRAKEATDFLAELTADQLAREDERRRLKEAELLYTVATTAIGAATPTSLAQRIVRELSETVRLDHLSIWSLSGEEATQLATEGTEMQIIDHVAFPQGKGVAGWLRSGTPVLATVNARNDARFPSQEAVRRRIGSLLIVPLEFGAEPFGFLVAATSKPAGIGSGETETLRAVSAELSQALARLKAGSRGPEGLATPKEFFEIVSTNGAGHLVYLEVIGQNEIAETFGKPAIEHAVRKFAVRLRSELPAGASMTRRNEGDYVVFVPNQDEDYVRRWANDATTLASLIGVRTPDGQTRIPLALRAKVAPINQQNNRFSTLRSA
jgi:GAF domain-containing protein